MVSKSGMMARSNCAGASSEAGLRSPASFSISAHSSRSLTLVAFEMMACRIASGP